MQVLNAGDTGLEHTTVPLSAGALAQLASDLQINANDSDSGDIYQAVAALGMGNQLITHTLATGNDHNCICE